MIFLSANKLDINIMASACYRLGYNHFELWPTNNHKGRLYLVWKTLMTVTPIHFQELTLLIY